MRKTFINLFSVVITAIWIAPGVMAQEVVTDKELPRFHRINDKLYRGAQPRRGGLMRLRQLGVKTIVNLRGSNEDTRSEEQHARALGLNYFNVPLGRIGRPSDAKVQRVLAILNAPENQPVFCSLQPRERPYRIDYCHLQDCQRRLDCRGSTAGSESSRDVLVEVRFEELHP